MIDYTHESDPIIGAELETIIFDKTEDTLTFVTLNGTKYIYSTDGDCCSNSWIEHLTIPSYIVGAKVTGKSEPRSLPTKRKNSKTMTTTMMSSPSTTPHGRPREARSLPSIETHPTATTAAG